MTVYLGKCFGMTGDAIQALKGVFASKDKGASPLGGPKSLKQNCYSSGKTVESHNGWLNCWINRGCKREKQKSKKNFWEGTKLINRSLWFFLSPMWHRKRRRKHFLFGSMFWMWTEVKSQQLRSKCKSQFWKWYYWFLKVDFCFRIEFYSPLPSSTWPPPHFPCLLQLSEWYCRLPSPLSHRPRGYSWFCFPHPLTTSPIPCCMDSIPSNHLSCTHLKCLHCDDPGTGCHVAPYLDNCHHLRGFPNSWPLLICSLHSSKRFSFVGFK